MRMSESIKSISSALLVAQKNIGKATKGESNPFYKSSYADLPTVMEVVKDPLNEAGISILQGVGLDDLGNEYVETTLLHESGEFISERMKLTVAKANDPQAQGSAISYAKRYSLQALLFVPSVDDDGEKAMGRETKKAPSKPTKSNVKAVDDWSDVKKETVQPSAGNGWA